MNILVEFEGKKQGFVHFVQILNMDRLRTTNDFPTEAVFAGHIQFAIEAKDKHAYMKTNVFTAFYQGDFQHRVVVEPPCQVDDHIIITVINE